jgi:hypothetical protein
MSSIALYVTIPEVTTTRGLLVNQAGASIGSISQWIDISTANCNFSCFIEVLAIVTFTLANDSEE